MFTTSQTISSCKIKLPLSPEYVASQNHEYAMQWYFHEVQYIKMWQNEHVLVLASIDKWNGTIAYKVFFEVAFAL